MAITQTDVELAAVIIRYAGWIFLYVFVGLGPGVIVGFLIANWVWGRGHPKLVDVHIQNQAQAAEHNKLFHPDHPRWQKS